MKVVKIFFYVFLITAFASLLIAEAQLPNKVYLPIIFSPSDDDILTVRAEYAPASRSTTFEVNALMEWNYQPGWDNYVILYRKFGATSWCTLNPYNGSALVNLLHIRSFQAPFIVLYRPYSSCFRQGYDDTSKYEFAIADASFGEHSNMSNIVVFDYVSTGGPLIPEYWYDVYPLEESGNVVVRWSNVHIAKVSINGTPVSGFYVNGKSALLLDNVPGEIIQVELYDNLFDSSPDKVLSILVK